MSSIEKPEVIPLLIGGKAIKKETDGGTRTILNPATEEVIGKVVIATKNEVLDTIKTAHTAFVEHRMPSLTERIQAFKKIASEIRKRRDDLALTMTKEIGRPIKSSRAEVERAAYTFELAAGYVGKAMEGRNIRMDQFIWPAGNDKRIGFTMREPLGVVVAITPFNFPLAAAAQKLAPSLIVGNSVVIKPSLSAPMTIYKLVEIIQDCGFSDGVINYVNGISSEIGNILVENEKVRAITFTGSSKVGLDIASRAVKEGKRVLMELGSSDPFIVLEDANIDRAAKFAAFARFDYAGQYCNAAKRFFIAAKIYDQFMSKFIEETQKLTVGDPMEEKTDMGPLINREAVDNFIRVVNDALSNGGKLIIGGKRIPGRGYFVEPTIISSSYESSIFKEETFYPLAAVSSFKDENELIERCNESEYGLDAAIFSRNFGVAFKIAQKLDVGTVIINDHTRLRWDGAPFGGTKKSGFGKESVWDSIMELTKEKFIVTNIDNFD